MHARHSRNSVFGTSLLGAVVGLLLLAPTEGLGAAPNNDEQTRDQHGDSSPNPPAKVPAGVILVKGAWSSASDSVTPLPEGGSVTSNVFSNQYFGVTYALPPDWT